jgi:hypothetical protein
MPRNNRTGKKLRKLDRQLERLELGIHLVDS